MKKIVCFCAILLSQSVPAALIDFNDIALGTEVSTVNFGSAVISTRLWVTREGSTVAESFTRGIIDNKSYINGSPSVVIEGGPRDGLDTEEARSRWNIEIAVSFQSPISMFSVDAYSAFYSTHLMYSGVNDMGETFTLSAGLLGGMPDRVNHFDIAAPTGGYITSFSFSQFEDRGSIMLAIDNLDYTSVTAGIGSSPVPESIGLPTFVFAICGVLFVQRRLKAAARM